MIEYDFVFFFLQVTTRPPLGVHDHKLHAVGWERCCPIAAGQTTYCRSNGGGGLRFGDARVQFVFSYSFFAYQHVSVRVCVLFNFVLVCCVVLIVPCVGWFPSVSAIVSTQSQMFLMAKCHHTFLGLPHLFFGYSFSFKFVVFIVSLGLGSCASLLFFTISVAVSLLHCS